MGEQGGWPLTMFLTPAGEPFWGGTYFPPEPRYGRPGFPAGAGGDRRRLSRQAATKVAQERRRRCARAARSVAPAAARRGAEITPDLLDRIAERLLREVDPLNGGIGTRRNSRSAGIFELLWRGLEAHRASEPYRDAVMRTLDDDQPGRHLRPSRRRLSRATRPTTHWLVPHFEKMLYDNAAAGRAC